MQKVMKYELHYLEGCVDFPEFQSFAWELQKKTREILNKTIQLCCQWEWANKAALETTGKYLSVPDKTGYKRYDGYIYHLLKDNYPSFSGANLNATIQVAWTKHTSSQKGVLQGRMSVPSYKAD